MKRLSSIIFSDSPITDISTETGEIKSLKKLRFTNTSFLQLNLTPLENLTHLTLEVYKGTLPKSGWSKLNNLEVLNIEYNFFNSLPEKIFHCSARIISLFCSALTALPDFPEESPIEELDLGGNKLESLPKSLAHLQKLKRLDLTSNSIMVLPKFLNELKNLTYLGLEDTGVFSTVDLTSTQLKSFELREEKEFQLPENFKVIKEHLPPTFFQEDGDLESIRDRLYTKIPPKKS